MNDLFQIIRRELLERKMLMIGALAIGAMILLTAFAPGNPPIPGIWNVLSMWWSIITLLGLSVYAGSSFVASELRENRFTFYLARPVSIRTLWAGKMLAAWLLALICAFLVVVPVTLTGNGLVLLFTRADEGNALLMLALLGVALVLVVFGHAAGIILRARSAWLLLDFVAFSFASLVFAISLRPLLMSWAFGLSFTLAAVSFLLLAAMLLVSGYLGLQSGRTDLARVHRTTSITTAIALITTALVVALYSWSVRSVDPHELRTVQILECGTLECNPVFTGATTGSGDYDPRFTIVGDSVISMPMALWAGTDPSGDWAIWIAPTAVFGPGFDVSFRSGPDDEIGSLGIETALWQLSQYAVRGDLLAFRNAENITVTNLRDDQIIRSMRIGEAGGSVGNLHLTFVDENDLLAIEQERGAFLRRFRILEIDLEKGESEETGSFEAFVFWQHGRHLIAKEGTARRVLDPRTGTVLVERNADDVVVAGKRAVFETQSRPTVLEITDLEGSTIREIPLPDSTDAVLGELVPDGRLAVSVRPSGRFSRYHWSESRLLLVDLETGAVEEVATDLVPARLQNPRVRGPWYLEALPDDRSRLVRFEPGHEMEIIAGPSR